MKDEADDEAMTLTDVRDMALNGLVGSAQVKEAMLQQIARELDAMIGSASLPARARETETEIDTLARLIVGGQYPATPSVRQLAREYLALTSSSAGWQPKEEKHDPR